MTGLWHLAFAAIGSAVGTAVNGGTFASFAVGMGISVAAMGIAGPFGNSIDKFASGFGALKDVIGYTLKGVLQGSISGAISSAVYGQNVWRGMGEGAIAGAIGGGVALAAAAVMGGGAQVIKDIGAGKPSGGGNIWTAMSAAMLAIAGPTTRANTIDVSKWSLELWATFAKIWVAEMNEPETITRFVEYGSEVHTMEIPPGYGSDEVLRQESLKMGPFEWKHSMRDYGPYDFKRINPNWENFGNYAFGKTGLVQGFTQLMLQRAAGIYAGVGAAKCLSDPAQYGKMPWSWLGGGKEPFCDCKDDQFFIKAGYNARR